MFSHSLPGIISFYRVAAKSPRLFRALALDCKLLRFYANDIHCD